MTHETTSDMTLDMRQILTILLAVVLVSCGGGRRKTVDAAATKPPVEWGYKVVAVHPHDPTAYTQGLFFRNGKLWESTGLHGQSRLMEIDLETGKAVRSAAVEDNYFAEGAVALGNRIYQLTWQDGVALAWNPETLVVEERFDIPEGWGLTTDGTLLYMSDGTSHITVVDPAGFVRKRQINVRAGRSSVQSLNELEWIGGKIWANIYMTDRIAIIDPASGRVEGIVDLSGLIDKGYEHFQRPVRHVDVLNGIAFDEQTGRTYVTGKLWPFLFEIELVP